MIILRFLSDASESWQLHAVLIWLHALSALPATAGTVAVPQQGCFLRGLKVCTIGP